MTIPKGNYGKPNLGKRVDLVGQISFGSEPYLITIGDDTTISFDVAFVTHDGGVRVIRNIRKDKNIFLGGPIVVGKNCFIGCCSVILPNVTIGDNCIIGAGSVVTKSIPPNSVAAGRPCRVICSLDEYVKKHEKDFIYIDNGHPDKSKEILLSKFKFKLNL